MSYIAFAEINVKPQHLDDARRAVVGIIAQTLAEPGCETFILHDATDGSPRLFLYERWRDVAAFEAHHAQPYTQSVYRSYESWLAAPPAITFLAEVEG